MLFYSFLIAYGCILLRFADTRSSTTCYRCTMLWFPGTKPTHITAMGMLAFIKCVSNRVRVPDRRLVGTTTKIYIYSGGAIFPVLTPC